VRDQDGTGRQCGRTTAPTTRSGGPEVGYNNYIKENLHRVIRENFARISQEFLHVFLIVLIYFREINLEIPAKFPSQLH
jgi:hypothetical protein